jgi:hypothetical protein
MSLSNEEIAVLKSLLDKLSPPPTEGVVVAPPIATPSPSPKIDLEKLKHGLFNILDPVLWMKEICSWINLRKIIIILLIAGSVYGWGYIKGVQGKPVHFDVQGKEAFIRLNGTTLHIKADGTAEIIDTKTGKKIKDINVHDVKDLDKLVTPLGFQLKPIGVLGVGYGGGKSSAEGGVGISWYHAWMANLESFITNKAIYPIGISYRLNQLKMPNSSVGIAGGLGYDKSQRVLFYYRWQF